MTRRCVTALLLALVVMRPIGAHAQSDVIDWLNQLSGPGPFNTFVKGVGKGYDINALCLPISVSWDCYLNDGVSDTTTAGNDAKWILRFGNTFASTGTQPLFQDDPNDKRNVAARTISTIFMYRANRIVDVGAGFRWVTYSTSDAPVFSFTRTGYVPVSIRVTPLGLLNAPDRFKWPARWKYLNRLVHFDAEWIRYTEGFSGTDFNNTVTKFSVGPEYQARLGYLIDGVALTRLIIGN